MSRVCPSCQKPLLSGFSPLCNLCGARLPPELRFTEEEKKRIEAEELKVRLQLEEMETERKKKAAAAAATWIYYS